MTDTKHILFGILEKMVDCIEKPPSTGDYFSTIQHLNLGYEHILLVPSNGELTSEFKNSLETCRRICMNYATNHTIPNPGRKTMYRDLGNARKKLEEIRSEYKI